MKHFILITSIIIPTLSLAMEEQHYTMTIKNELFCKIFLNVKNPNSLTSQSPYPSIEGQTSKTFLVNEEEKAHQTLAFPNGYPCDTVKLPIEKNKTYFTIKKHPTEWQKVLVEEDDSQKIIAELLVLSNPK